VDLYKSLAGELVLKDAQTVSVQLKGWHDLWSCKCELSLCAVCHQKVKECSLDDHNIVCSKLILPCPCVQYGCEFTGTRQMIGSHITACSLNLANCKYDTEGSCYACHKHFYEIDKNGHLCESYHPCPMRGLGCDYVALFSEDLSKHMSDCKYREIVCVACGNTYSYKAIFDHHCCNYLHVFNYPTSSDISDLSTKFSVIADLVPSESTSKENVIDRCKESRIMTLKAMNSLAKKPNITSEFKKLLAAVKDDHITTQLSQFYISTIAYSKKTKVNKETTVEEDEYAAQQKAEEEAKAKILKIIQHTKELKKRAVKGL